MLSEDHTANFLTFWMQEFVKMHADIPKVFVCDMSLALIIAAVRSFGLHANIIEYIDTIFNLLINKNDSKSVTNERKIPPCLIRIDFAHFMNNLRRMKSLNSAEKWPQVKEFYMRCVAILIQIKSLEFAQCHIYSVLIVAKSKTVGMLTKQYKSTIPHQIGPKAAGQV